MTGIGKLVECREDLEVVNLDINFYEDIYYTALIGDKIYVIDRNHKSIEVSKDIFKKHFKNKI